MDDGDERVSSKKKPCRCQCVPRRNSVARMKPNLLEGVEEKRRRRGERERVGRSLDGMREEELAKLCNSTFNEGRRVG